LICLAACGGQSASVAPAQPVQAKADSEPPATAKASAEAPAADEEEATSGKLPEKCAKPGADVCTPSKAFTDKLCQNTYPGVALAMFRKGTPWTRGYLTRKTKAWNASGGASDSGELAFDEEVLVLRKRGGDAGGMQVSGSGGYDALRWNGSCVTLASEELTLKLPPQPKSSHVEWRFLGDGIQEKLREADSVNKAYRARRNECKGATMGSVTLKCQKADGKLSDAIIDYVRSGGEIPTPDKLP
jgi:hypothetical protein